MSETQTYQNFIEQQASVAAFTGNVEDAPPLLSIETVAEASGTSIQDYATESTADFLKLLEVLRSEWQELAIEYFVLGKTQYFLEKAHKHAQYQLSAELTIIERALGAAMILGLQPAAEALRPILEDAGVEETAYGRLSEMIVIYAKTQNYRLTAESFGMPIPKVRKEFHHAIDVLSASKDLKATAVGAYLRNQIYQASLQRTGLNDESRQRLRSIREMRFDARIVSVPTDDWSDEAVERRLAQRQTTKLNAGDFVRILFGELESYHGVVTAIGKSVTTVRVEFPTGRKFIVCADPEALRIVKCPKSRQAFWGIKP